VVGSVFVVSTPGGAAKRASGGGGAQRPDDPPRGGFRPPTPRNFYLYGKATDALDLFFGFRHILAMLNILAIPNLNGKSSVRSNAGRET
jgi:hypothetical protein